MKKWVRIILLFLFTANLSLASSSVFAAGSITPPTKEDGSVDVSAPASSWGGPFGWLGFALFQMHEANPVARSGSLLTFQNQSTEIAFEPKDSFGRSLVYTLLETDNTKARYGRAEKSIRGPDGWTIFTYIPNTNLDFGTNTSLTDAFAYQVQIAGTNKKSVIPGLISVTIHKLKSPPVVNHPPEPRTIAQIFDHHLGESITFDLGPAKDVDGDLLTYRLEQGLDSNVGTVSFNSPTSIKITAGPHCENKIYTLIFSVVEQPRLESDTPRSALLTVNVEMKNCDFHESDPGHHGDDDMTEPYIKTHMDTIPRFEHAQNAINWDGTPRRIYTISEAEARGPNELISKIFNSEIFKKQGGEPGGDDVLVLKGNITVTYDLIGFGIHTLVLQRGAHLKFATKQDTQLRVVNMRVDEGAFLEVGSADEPILNPYRSEIILRDAPLQIHSIDPFQWGGGLLVFGKLSMHGNEMKRTFLRATREPHIGDIDLMLEEEPENWMKGDRLFIPDTRQFGTGRDNLAGQTYNKAQLQWEEVEVESVQGKQVRIKAPYLKFNHLGAYDGKGKLTFLPHVTNLTRNVVIRSETPQENGKERYCYAADKFTDWDVCVMRGHTAFLHRAEVDVRYVEFRNLGRTVQYQGADRTEIVPIDKPKVDAGGNWVPGTGTNQIARYSFHAHHLFGPEHTSLFYLIDPPLPPEARVAANTHQFIAIGNSINGGFEAHGFKWGMAIHSSHYGLIKDNVIYNMVGAGISTEDGSESHNLFDRNIVLRTDGNGGRGKFRSVGDDVTIGITGGAYWLSGLNNYFRNNVGANSSKADFEPYGGNNTPMNPAKVPIKQGDDPHESGQSTLLPMESMYLLEFTDNESYASPMGIDLWYIGYINYYNPAPDPKNSYPLNLIKNFHSWHNSDFAIHGNNQHHLTVDNLIAIGDIAQTHPYSYPIGIDFHQSKKIVVQNSRIENFRVGIIPPGPIEATSPAPPGTTVNTVTPTLLKNLFLKNEVNILITMFELDAFQMLPPRVTHIDNVRFDKINNGKPQFNIDMGYMDGRFRNTVIDDVVKVFNYNGVAGDNFQVFYKEQAPNFVMTQTGANSSVGAGSPVGCPEANMTNQQCRNKYGVSIAGSISSCTTSTLRLEIDGFTCPI